MSVANSLLVLLVEELDEWHKVFQSSDLARARELHTLAVSLAAKLKTGRDLGDTDGRRRPWSEERRQKVGTRVKAGWALRRASQPFLVDISGNDPIEVRGYDNLRRLIYGDIKRVFPGITTSLRDAPYLETTKERQVRLIKNGLSTGDGTYSTTIMDSSELHGAPVTITRLPMPSAEELRAAVTAAVTGAPTPSLASSAPTPKPKPKQAPLPPVPGDNRPPPIRRVPPKKAQP